MPYGKNMRSCCDSLAHRNAPHINGCVYYRTKTFFMQLDDSHEIIRFDNEQALDKYLQDHRVQRNYDGVGVNALASADTIVDDRHQRRGSMLVLEQNTVIA